MRVLQVHNFYRSDRPSGENLVAERELAMLRQGGVTTGVWHRHSDDLLRAGWIAQARAACRLSGPPRLVADLRRQLRDLPGDILHAHNVWPLFTMGLFQAAREEGRLSVLTTHNHRLISSNTHYLGRTGAQRPRDQQDLVRLRRMMALHGSPAVSWCYTRGVQRAWDRGIPQSQVDAYICLTDFQRRLFCAAGLPPEKIVVKPNFIAHDGAVGTGPGDYVLFVGRLAAEKGVHTLAKAWAGSRLPLVVVGSGPLDAAVRSAGADVRGALPIGEVLKLMTGARFLVMNSTCFEGFPLVLIEAMASAIPCLVPNLGGLPEIIRDGELGRLFAPDDPQDLIRSAMRLWDEAPAMRAACRAEYERRYTPGRNLAMLRKIYENLLAKRRPDEGVAEAGTVTLAKRRD